MAWLIKCDGCGKTEVAPMVNHVHKKPKTWFQRKDEASGEVQDSCSLDCIRVINDRIGKNAEVRQ